VFKRGCFQFRQNKKEALDNLEEALEFYFEDKDMSKITAVEKPAIVRRQLQYA